MLHIIQDGVAPHIGEDPPYPCDQHNVARPVIAVLHVLDVSFRRRDTLNLFQHKLGATLLLHLRYAVQNASLLADVQQYLIKVIKEDPAGQMIRLCFSGRTCKK